MPLSSPKTRETMHTRKVTCTGHRRDDGLWDIEGHLIDEKTYEFSNDERGKVLPGEPVHEMWIRLTITEKMEIKDVEAVTDHSPFSVCRNITPNFQKLITFHFVTLMAPCLGPWQREFLSGQRM